MILGLTFTEWMSKVREEEVTYDLITAMADDFFFAYDVLEFISMSTRESHIYNSNWVYICFTFAFISMFKYTPAQPTSICGGGAPRGATAYILAGMILCDIPFVIIRITTLGVYGFDVSDLIHPVKNVAMIIFDCTQLYIIHRTVKDVKDNKTRPKFKEKRISRNPEWWDENAVAINDSELSVNNQPCNSNGGQGRGNNTVMAITDVEDVESNMVSNNGDMDNRGTDNGGKDIYTSEVDGAVQRRDTARIKFI